jgi:hypothetical protein
MAMRHWQRLAACCACSLAATVCTADPHQFTAQLDVRYVLADSPYRSFTQGGLGLTRFDESHDSLRLGSLLLDAAGPVTETVRYAVTASATGDGDQNPIDLTEAYLEWRPYPTSGLRSRTRLGAFYPAVSLENRNVGWQSQYSISSSAINSWLGEELRAIGAESALTLDGSSRGSDFDVSVIGGVFGWNDPAGVLIYQRGWAIHDRQSALFGHLPRPLVFNPAIQDIEFFDEVDGRAGYYAGAEVKWASGQVLRAFHYDNRGNIDQIAAREPTWDTAFDAFGMRLEFPADITFIAQYLEGTTAVRESPTEDERIITDLSAWFMLVSALHGPHRLTLRRDRMHTRSEYFGPLQNAQAWTAAYLLDIDQHWQVVAEAVRITGTLQQRALLGQAVASEEQQLQLAVRFTF